MHKYHCLNPIAAVGLDLFSDDYQKVEDLKDAEAVLVRSAAMHDLELPEGLAAVARAGAGVNNIPLDKCAEKGIVVFNTPGANANGVKELVFAGMLYASRDIVGGIDWCLANQNDETWCNRCSGCQCGDLHGNGSVRLRSVYFRQCSVEPFPEREAHQQRGGHLPRVRLYHDSCAAFGFHQKDDWCGCDCNDEADGDRAQLCERSSRG